MKSSVRYRMLSLGVVSHLVLIALMGCSKSGSQSSSSSGLNLIPAVAPIVNAAPPAFRISTRAQRLLDQMLTPFSLMASWFSLSPAHADIAQSDVVANLGSIFRGTYGKLSGGDGTGYINSLLEDLDSRMAELKSRFSGQSIRCMNQGSHPVAIALESVFSGFSLTLDVQCQDRFDAPGDQSYTGSGMLFGQDSITGDYSLWLGLNHQEKSGFGYAARVKHPTSESDKEVDLIFVEASPENARGSIARLKAKPSTQSYELVYRSTSSNGISPKSGGGAISVGHSFDLISDGTYIYVQVKYNQAGQQGCDNATSFSACLNASDLTSATTESCNSLAGSFTIATQTAINNAVCPQIPVPTSTETTLFNAIQISNGDGVTTRVTAE